MKNVIGSYQSCEQSELIANSILENISRLDRNKTHDVKSLMGRELWAEIDNHSRRCIGKVVFKLVSNRRLPVIYEGKTTSNKHIYRIA